MVSNKNPKQEALPEWVVEFEVHPDDQTYRVAKVYEKHTALAIKPYLYVNAIDEIAAFNKARVMMVQLGFNAARDPNDG